MRRLIYVVMIAIMVIPGSHKVLAQIEEFGVEGVEVEDQMDANCIPESLDVVYDNFQDPDITMDDIRKWYSFGSEYHKNKNYRSGLPYLWKVFVNDTGKYGALAIRKIAYSYWQLQQADSTLIACYRGLERYPNHPNLHYYAGYLNDRVGKYRCAIPHYEKLVEEEPDTKSYLEKLAFLYYKDGDERAIEVQQRLVELEPENGEYQSTLAQYYEYFMGSALEPLQKAYESDKQNMKYALSYGKAAYNAGEYRAALEPLSAVITNDPESAEAYEYRAMSNEALEQYNAAITDYKRVLELDPDNAKIMCSIATNYRYLNQFSNGAYWVNRALQTKPGFGLAHIVMAEIYESAVVYCQEKEQRGRKYDDGLVYRMAYREYEKAEQDANYAAMARRRKNSLKSVLPTEEEIFMNQNRTTLKEDCYTSWIN